MMVLYHVAGKFMPIIDMPKQLPYKALFNCAVSTRQTIIVSSIVLI